jgi:hypothetical protein
MLSRVHGGRRVPDEKLSDDVKATLREAAEAGRRAAASILWANAAGALKKPLSAEDVIWWTKQLADHEAELLELDDAARY